MEIGIPRETKVLEGRVGLIPAAAGDLVKSGHKVFIETAAGQLSGYMDEDYAALGVEVVDNAEALYAESKLIVKVKEPTASDLKYLKKHHVLFCYLHLAAEPELTKALQEIGLTAVAFETVEVNGRLPLLAPMSDIAGRLSIQIGAQLLHQPNQGKGLMLGGVPGVRRGRVVIIGGGVAGSNAARVAAGLGAEVYVFERKRERQEMLRGIGANVTSLYPYQDALQRMVAQADLVVGAVLVTGARAPHVVSEQMVKDMEAGSVIVDISIDQGGCVETMHATNYENPTFVRENVVHFAVTNMPGAVPHTAAQALSAAILPYVHQMASVVWQKQPELVGAINVKGGKIVHPALK